MNLGEKTLRTGDGRNYFMSVCFLAVVLELSFLWAIMPEIQCL